MLGKITEVSEGQLENLAFLGSLKMLNRTRNKALLLTSHKKHLFFERNDGCQHTGSCTGDSPEIEVPCAASVLTWHSHHMSAS